MLSRAHTHAHPLTLVRSIHRVLERFVAHKQCTGIGIYNLFAFMIGIDNRAADFHPFRLLSKALHAYVCKLTHKQNEPNFAGNHFGC